MGVAQTGLWRWAPGPPDHYTFPVAQLRPVRYSKTKRHTIDGHDHPVRLERRYRSIEGLKRLVDGKIRSYPLPGFAEQFRPTCLFRSSDGSLWIGTVQGLLHFHQGRIDRFSVTDGLSGDIVTGHF